MTSALHDVPNGDGPHPGLIVNSLESIRTIRCRLRRMVSEFEALADMPGPDRAKWTRLAAARRADLCVLEEELVGIHD